jgi:hypothetical protein
MQIPPEAIMSGEMHKRLLALEARLDMIPAMKREIGRLSHALSLAETGMLAQSEEIARLRTQIEQKLVKAKNPYGPAIFLFPQNGR